MTKSRLVRLGVASFVLVLAAAGGAVGATAVGGSNDTTVYTVGGRAVPGVDTGLVLRTGMSATVTATGAVCVSGSSMCPGPNGDSAVDTTSTAYGGYPLPGAPAYGLIGRVGDGPWVQVGSGPATLSGTGSVQFAVNDDYLPDNRGSFAVTVTVSYACFPGWGYGDPKHPHAGPPGILDDCYPGNGYGDANHTHGGPPGLTDTSTPDARGASEHSAPPSDDQHGQGVGNGKSQGKHGK